MDRKKVIVSPDTQREVRLPPNQVRAKKWTVLDAGGPPDLDAIAWSFEVTGLVERPGRWSWDEFRD